MKTIVNNPCSCLSHESFTHHDIRISKYRTLGIIKHHDSIHSAAAAPAEPVYQSPEEIHQQKIAALISNFNHFFNTQFTTIDELKPDALNRVKVFYSAVRNCTPGRYQYILQYMAGVVFYTSEIKGEENGKCIVNSTFAIPTITEGSKTCKYTPASRLLFSEDQADFDGAGKSNFDLSNPTRFQQVEMNECRYTAKLLTDKH